MLDEEAVVVVGSDIVVEIISLVGVTFLNAELALLLPPDTTDNVDSAGLGEVVEGIFVVEIIVIVSESFSFFIIVGCCC